MTKKSIVSIIVTTRNSEEVISSCLKSLKEQTYTEKEIIVVDNKSTDDTKKIARRYTKNVFDFGPERSAQRNFGARKANGEFLLFVDSDMELSQKVVTSCVALIHSPIKGIVIPEESFGRGFWAKCKKLERSFYYGIDWIEAARFFPKKVFWEMKGYDEKNTGTEDYDLPQRIKKKYGKKSIARIRERIYHNEGDLSLLKTMKKKYYYSKNLHQYKSITANAKSLKTQASIVRRYKIFFASPKKLFKDPVIGCGMLVMKSCEFVAGGVGYVLKRSL